MTTASPLVLIVEDDEGLRHLTSRQLQRAGYRVELAADGNAARAEIALAVPDLLILDYDLKTDETGLDFFRALCSDGLTLPAILVTGFTDSGRVIEALRAGVADVLPKSGDYLAYLPEAIARLINQVQLRQRLAAAEVMREREMSYRTLSEAIPQLVWTCRSNGHCDFLSKQWLDYTGAPEEQQLGSGWLDMTLHPDDLARTRAAWQAAVDGRADYDLELRLRRFDGCYRWFKARGLPLRDGNGTILKWFGTCTDIEDNKQADQEREALLASERAARTEAERAVRVKDEFVATLSHELRTPLNAILGWAQFLLRDRSDPVKLSKGLEVIHRNARLQAQMVDDLLDMSRIMSGKLRLDVSEMELAPVIDNVLASVQPAADAKEICITGSADAGILILGDPARLQQVLWNLVMNAIKFTPRQGTVTIALRRRNTDAELAVSDSGKGIKAEFLAHVFDRFRQEDSSTTRIFSGLGLGLAITRQLVEMHGGDIHAASDGEGRGATFTVHLPLCAPRRNALVSAPAGLPRAQSDAGVDPRLDGMHILLVEDEPDGRDLVQRLLEDRGARVTACASAAAGLDAFMLERPDLVLSDIGMPIQDGYEFLRLLRQREGSANPPIPAVALTALARSEDRQRALLAGFQSHIAKPVDPLELVVVLATLARPHGKR